MAIRVRCGCVAVIATRRDLLDAKGDDRLIPLLIHARLEDPEVKSVPLFSNALKDDVNVATYKAYMAQMEYQRPLTVSPGTPKERLEILRRAFRACDRAGGRSAGFPEQPSLVRPAEGPRTSTGRQRDRHQTRHYVARVAHRRPSEERMVTRGSRPVN